MDQALGLIGVGLVGTALAERLLERGWEVHGYDLDPSRLMHLRQVGGHSCESADEIVQRCQTIVVSLPTSLIATSTLQALRADLTGRLFVDTTTGEPTEMLGLAQKLTERGARYLDATIAGSSVQVRSGEVIVMVGGPAEDITACRPLFDAFARQTFHTGDWGSGARMKLVVNLVLGLHRGVLAEGLKFAEKIGVDPFAALEVLKSGPTYSRVMDTKALKMLGGDFTPQARLAQHLKDVNLILKEGSHSGARLPFSTLHAQLLGELAQQGFGELDNSAIIKAFETP